MRIFRSALIVLLLVLAQATALVHALEHLRVDDATHPAHQVCGQCLAAQGLDAPLVATPLSPQQSSAVQARVEYISPRSAELFRIFRYARAPPVF